MAHSRQHDISTAAEHSASGLTAGHVLRATAATTFAFAAIGASDLPTAIDAANIANGTISNAEFQYLNGVTGAIQGQIDAKMPLAGGTFTGDVLFQVAEQCRFRQATEYFASDNPGYLDAHAATAFRLTTTGRVSLTCPANGVLGVAGDVWVISDGGDPRIVLGDTWSAGDYGSIRWVSASDSIGIGTQAGGVDTLLISEAGNVLLAGTGQFQFGDSGTYLYQSANSILSYVADGRHEFGGGPVYVGSGSPGHTITGAGDLYVADRFEVDGAAYFDDQTYFYGLMDCRDQHVMSFFGSTFGGLYRVGGDGLHFHVYGGAGTAQNRNIIICDYDARADDYDHSAVSADPTLFIQSDTRAGVALDQWWSIAHDRTDALYNVGTGTHKFGQTVDVTGNITVTGTVDGVDVAAHAARHTDGSDDIASAGAAQKGVVDTGAQTWNGVKTFGSFPVTPSAAPTTDYQVANKKYVDDNVGVSAMFNAYRTDTFDMPANNTWYDYPWNVEATVQTNVTHDHTGVADPVQEIKLDVGGTYMFSWMLNPADGAIHYVSHLLDDGTEIPGSHRQTRSDANERQPMCGFIVAAVGAGSVIKLQAGTSYAGSDIRYYDDADMPNAATFVSASISIVRIGP